MYVCTYLDVYVPILMCMYLYLCSSSDFMYGLHQMFIGDARPHEKDEWLFLIIESMNDVIIPAVRMSLKLHEVINHTN